MQKKLFLPNQLVEKLETLPESGLGYQLVSVYLNNGQVLQKRKVINCEFLLLCPKDSFVAKDIIDVELDQME